MEYDETMKLNKVQLHDMDNCRKKILTLESRWITMHTLLSHLYEVQAQAKIKQ